MPWQMIDFKCSKCEHEFEELTKVSELGTREIDPEECPKCGAEAPMIMDIKKRIHRDGNRYRDVSWSTWSIS